MIPPTFPSAEQLRPVLEKLEAHPGSVVLLAIEGGAICNFCRVTVAWFSAEERKALRRALEIRATPPKGRRKAHNEDCAVVKPERPCFAYPQSPLWWPL